MEAAWKKIVDFDKENRTMLEERERLVKALNQHEGHCKHGGHRVPSVQTAEIETIEQILSRGVESKFL